MTFDVHAHVIVPEITGDEAWQPRVWRDDAGNQVVELGGKQIHAAVQEFVDIDAILAAQDEAGVDRVLLCPWVPLLYYDAEPDEGLARARIQNDALAALVRDHPDRLAALGGLPLQDPELAAGELRALMARRGAEGRGGRGERPRRLPRRRSLRAVLGGGGVDRGARVHPSHHARVRLAGVPGLLPLEHRGEPAGDGHRRGAHGRRRRDGAPSRPARPAGARRRRAAGGARPYAPRSRIPAPGSARACGSRPTTRSAASTSTRSRTTTRCCEH